VSIGKTKKVKKTFKKIPILRAFTGSVFSVERAELSKKDFFDQS